MAPLAVTLSVALAGCSSPVVDALEAPRSTPPAPANPDQPAVDAVIEATTGLVSALRPLRAKDPVFADLVSLHDAHLTRLGPVVAPVPVPTPTLDGSREQVRAHEAHLAGMIADRAGAVQDGDLARLLASMSAAVSQRVTQLGSAA